MSTKSVLITLIYWIIYSPYYQFICLFIYLISCSCVQAEPPVNASTRDKYCIFYEYTTGTLCKGIITSLYVFGNQATVDYGDRETFTFQSYFNFFEISERCQPIMRDLFCRYHYQPCDMSLRIPRPRRICRRTCEHLDYVLCVKEMAFIRNAAKTAPRFDYDMINCSIYTVANGGDAPECYQYQPLLGLYTEGSPVLFNRPSLARIRFQMGSFFWGPENFVNIINFEFFFKNCDSFLVLWTGAIFKWRNTKDWKVTEQYTHQKMILGWFSNKTGTSVDEEVRKSNKWLDQWQSGELGTGSRV